jgi:enamine deaminase RidA (YjgF/YER057c/UK114 family)
MIPIGQEKIKILTRFRSLTKPPWFRQYAKMNESPTNRLKVLGLTLPPAPKPVAAYVPFVRTGNLIFVSGQLPFQDGKLIATGSVPTTTSIEAATAAARQAALNGLAVLADAAGGLDRIRKIIRVGVFVCSDVGFTEQPKVANGASEFLQQIFGEAGRHARAAVGNIALPLGASVEVELLAEIME